MTHEQFREAIANHRTNVTASGIRSGYTLQVINLSMQIEDHLAAAEGRHQDAHEYALVGNAAMAAMHRKRAAAHIASARALIDTTAGREAYQLYRERAGNV